MIRSSAHTRSCRTRRNVTVKRHNAKAEAWYKENKTAFKMFVEATNPFTIKDDVSGVALLKDQLKDLNEAEQTIYMDNIVAHVALEPTLSQSEIAQVKGVFDLRKKLADAHLKAGIPYMSADKNDQLYEETLGEYMEPIRVAVTGAAGAIGYSLVHRLASGHVFGNRRVILQLLELPAAEAALNGVVMELEDCAFPTLAGVEATTDANKAFEGVDYAFLVGAKPRGPGMERSDLLKENGKIFTAQGKALNTAAKGKDTRVIVVGNPANTNALIAQTHAKKIPAENFVAMTRLDHNRGLAQIADKVGVATTDISNFAIWGNHSATQFPDISHTVLNDGRKVADLVDQKWVEKDFIPVVQQRGAAIITARGASSAASAASAAADNIHDWHVGTNGQWTSAAIASKGEYGITPGLFYSYPVIYSQKQHTVVEGLPLSEFAKQRMEETHKELLAERDAVSNLL